MKISLWQQFYKNLRHPKQSAGFRFLKVGYNIFYCFFLTLIVAILFSPTIIEKSISTSETISYIFLPLMLVLYYILLCALAFFFVSILSIVALPIRSMLKRKLNYLQVWSITINAITWPTLILAVVNLAFSLPSFVIWLYILATLSMITYAIYSVPKPKKKPVKPIPAKG